jgi:hypothetical protein
MLYSIHNTHQSQRELQQGFTILLLPQKESLLQGYIRLRASVQFPENTFDLFGISIGARAILYLLSGLPF